MMNDVFGCIVNRIETEINETCMADERVILVKAIGLQINSTLALPFSLDFCKQNRIVVGFFKSVNHSFIVLTYIQVACQH